MAVLKKVSPEPAGQLLEIKADPFVIGRLQECQVILDSTGVSRKHAEIRRSGERFALVDLHSRNFTFLNGRKLDPNEPPPLLAANDKIKICDVEFIFFPTSPRNRLASPRRSPTRSRSWRGGSRKARGRCTPSTPRGRARWPAP